MFFFLFALSHLSLSFQEKRPKLIKEGESTNNRIVNQADALNEIEKYFTNLEYLEENGGAILLNVKPRINCTLQKCHFNSCKAKNGGALYIYYANDILVMCNIFETTFIDCYSTSNGGAAYFQNDKPSLHSITLDKCTFTGNKAGKNGGAIYATVRDKFEITNCNFNNNQVGANGKGSSMFCQIGWYQASSEKDDIATFTNNNFSFSPNEENTINVYIESRNITDKNDKTNAHSVVSMGRCTFASNDQSATGFKHLVLHENNKGFQEIKFPECNCVRQGKDTIEYPTKFTLENFNFDCSGDTCTPGEAIPGIPEEKPEPPEDTNTPPSVEIPTDDTSDDGYTPITEKIDKNMENATVTVSKSVFRNIKNSGNGGAILIQRSNVTINECKFVSNEATSGGAVNIYVTRNENNYKPPLFCTITKCIFRYNTATSSGGACYLRSTQPNIHQITVEDCNFTTNVASKNGGAIYIEGRDEFLLQRCIFTGNSASKGSSLWLKVGTQKGKDDNDTAILFDNQFVAGQNSASNVYIETATSEISPHACIFIGGCTFSTENPSSADYKNLIFVDSGIAFKSIQFTRCNCFMQDSNSLQIPSTYGLSNVQFKCTSIDSCKPGDVIPPSIPDASPTPRPPDADGYTESDRIVIPLKPIDVTKYKFTEIDVNNENGGAVVINSTKRVSCSLVDCKFTSCHAQSGGALYLNYATNKYVLLVSKCQFDKCEATQKGGAIYLSSTKYNDCRITIESSTFTANKAGTFGGAVYLEVRNNFTMEHCTFTNNEAKQKGSSLWCQAGWDQESEVNLVSFADNTFAFTPSENSVNVYFQNNKINATKFKLNADLSLGISRFSTNGDSNVAFKHLEIANVGDGFHEVRIAECICVQQGKKTVTLPEGLSDAAITYNCASYETCNADADGYKYHSRIGDEERAEPINLEKFKFINLLDDNDGKGGAINIFKQKTSLTLNNCKFESCQSGQYGGAVYIQYTGSNNETAYAASIKKCIFSNNEAVTNGGALYCYITQSNLHSITISHCTFNSNKVNKNGGAIYALVRDSFTVDHCIFNGNHANGDGCSLWLRIGDSSTYNVNEAYITDNTFTITPKSKDDINVYIENSKLNDDTTPNANLILNRNIFDSGEGNTKGFFHVKVVAPSEFESIRSEQCNCVKQGSETVTLPYVYSEFFFNFECKSIDTCTTQNPTPGPTADTDGYIPSSRIDLNVAPTVTLTKTKFISIESEKAGGAISLVKVSCLLTQCKFDKCKSTIETKDYGGGAIYLSYTGTDATCSATIINCEFSNCESSNCGGAVDINITQPKRHSAIVEGCTFTNNKATKLGGALYSIARDLVTIQHSTFTNNEAATGSSLWVQVGWNNKKGEDNDQFILYGNSFEYKPTEANPINVYIKSNKLEEQYSPNANVFIGHCSFIASNVNGNEQKQLRIDEDGTFQSIVFTDCNCIQGDENTVFINATSKPNLDNAFHYNCNNIGQCPSGSEKPPESSECKNMETRREIYGGQFEIENSCFYDLKSSASREGGAIHAINTKIELENCRFKSCSSDKEGGAVYVSFSISECQFEIEKCTFEDCSSGAQGGALFFENKFASKSSIKECKFINNKAASHGGAVYYSPCANSKLSKCFFVNNTCTGSNNVYGSSIYILVKNLNTMNKMTKLRIKDDEETNKVIVEGNRIRSEPAEGIQQMYINLKKTGNLQLGDNSFSFNGAKETPKNSKYIDVKTDEGAQLEVTGDICVDLNNASLINGINTNIEYDCHKADSENDENNTGGKNKNKNNVGMIVGIVVACVVVIAIVVVVVILVKRKKDQNKYISDIGDGDVADGSTGPITNNDPEMAT